MPFPKTRSFFLGILVLFSVSILSSQSDEKVVTAERIRGSISVDGLLNEPDWRRTQPVRDLIQYDPGEGEEPTEQSVVLFLYDDNALYIGAILYDGDPHGVVGQLSRRDRYTHADRFEVWIDSNNDRLTAYRFTVNVSNVQADGIFSDDGARYDASWDAVWESATTRIARGWSVEMRIPFTALRFDPREDEYHWGINIIRFIARKNEEIRWIIVPRRETGLVSRFGTLRGLRNINPPRHVELRPYVVSQGHRQSDAVPRISERDITGNAGMDVKLGLATNTTLDLAINPDYGQVEIDQSIINLTAFETFYAEKRPFFLEGAELFRFGSTFDGRQTRLFYSRRVGRAPGLIRLTPGEEFIEMPQATRILGAAKITGRTREGLSIGMLSTLTSSEEAIVRTQAGDRLYIPVEPRGLYNVIRMRQDISENSAIGMMATGVVRDGMETAVSGGMDWNLRFMNNSYVIDGFIAGTRTGRYGEILEGWAGRLYAAKPSGRHWLVSANYDFFSRDFNPNDIGYLSRADYQTAWADIYYKDDYLGGVIRRYMTRLAAETRWNMDGFPIKQDSQISGYAEFSNFWSASVHYRYNFSSYDDFETRGTGLYKRPVYHLIYGSIATDQRNSVIAYPSFDIRWADYGYTEYYLSLDFDVRPTPSVELSPAVGLFKSDSYEAWFANINDAELGLISLFGDRDVDQIDFSLRGILTLHTRLSVQFFTQVLLSKVSYRNQRYLASPDDLREFELTDEHPSYRNPDFNYQGFNANIILRWEFVRGSTFYAVWTQERNGIHSHMDQRFGSNFRDTFRTPMKNVFLIKVNYWFSI